MTVPVDVFVLVAGACEAAVNEIETLNDTSPPVPGALQILLDERLALIATMKRACEANEGLAKRLRATYREEVAKGHHDAYELPTYAVDQGLLAELEDVRQTLERRLLSDRDVDHALRGEMERGWAW